MGQEHWQRFLQTGRIQEYLLYRLDERVTNSTARRQEKESKQHERDDKSDGDGSDGIRRERIR